MLQLRRQLKYPRKKPPGKTNLTTVIISFPLSTQSAMKEIEDNTTLVFNVDVKPKKQQIKQAVKRLYDPDEAKASTIMKCLAPGFRNTDTGKLVRQARVVVYKRKDA